MCARKNNGHDWDAEFAGQIIVELLGGAQRPLKRWELVHEIHARANGVWSLATAQRRFKEGRAWLVKKGVPVVSCGEGFFLATKPHEFNAAARLKESAAKRLWQEARRLRRMAPQYREPILFEAAW
jgi:hypothetical protein